jgi:transketolase
MDTMRERFTTVTTGLLDADPRLAVVLADITADGFAAAGRAHPDRVINLGIREQLLISVAGGLALAGMRPIAHTFASFPVERPFEQIKIDQPSGAAAVPVARARRSITRPPAHPPVTRRRRAAWRSPAGPCTCPATGQAEPPLRAAAPAAAGLPQASAPPTQPAGRKLGFTVVLRGSAATILAVGPLADAVLAATAGVDVTVLYAATIRPFDRRTLRATLAAPVVVTVEPYLAGTSAAEVAAALADLPNRALGLGVGRRELRRYGTPEQHEAAHGLDPASLPKARRSQ